MTTRDEAAQETPTELRSGVRARDLKKDALRVAERRARIAAAREAAAAEE